MAKKQQRKPLYVVQINLSGLHNKVYEVKWNKELEQYWDHNISYDPADKIDRWGIVQLVFDNKRDAEIALKGARMVCQFFLNQLQLD